MSDTLLEIRKIVFIAAPADRVFGPLTRPEEIIRAYPYARARLDPRPGGELAFGGGEDEAAFNDYGGVEAFAAPCRFRYRYWSDNHGTPRTPENHLTIDYRLLPQPAGVDLEVTHAGMGPGAYHDTMVAAWDVLLDRLKAYAEA